ncbi:hypothetical protein ACH5RR_022854 [Cinchona calisaya]|uniref:Uncharacterized protein n=1 Tax=Cinchona calisaya TaxID=153742 RepID=A0ABD2Z8Z9_9GENT
MSSNQTLDAIRDQHESIYFITKGATLDGTESSDNTISGPGQLALVAYNLGKPSDLTLLSNGEIMPVMPTIPIIAQTVLCALAAPSIFSVTAIVFEKHRKAALGIGERIQ